MSSMSNGYETGGICQGLYDCRLNYATGRTYGCRRAPNRGHRAGPENTLRTESVSRRRTFAPGSVLVHGEDEQTGQHYLMLEGIDARVRFIESTPEMEEARARGDLRLNNFVRMRLILIDGDLPLQIDDSE